MDLVNVVCEIIISLPLVATHGCFEVVLLDMWISLLLCRVFLLLIVCPFLLAIRRIS